MKKTKLTKAVLFVTLAIVMLTVGIYAGGTLEKISVYRNYGISVLYNGVPQTMVDVNGKRVYPLSYEGTTYLPIRAISNILGVDVNWDQNSHSVLLGKTGKAVDFLETIPPYDPTDNAGRFQYFCAADKKTIKIAGKTYNHWIYMYTPDALGNAVQGYFDLGGAYDTLTFDVYCEKFSGILNIYGDNGALLQSIEVVAKNLPKTYSVNVSGVSQLVFSMASGARFYLINMTIE